MLTHRLKSATRTTGPSLRKCGSSLATISPNMVSRNRNAVSPEALLKKNSV